MKFISNVVLLVKFVSVFVYQLCLANIRVAYYILVPGAVAKAGVIAYPLDVKSDTQLTVLAIAISLTPGTLALDVSSDKRYLYLHTMVTTDKQKLIDEIKDHLEYPIMRLSKWK